ncbi:caspase-1-like [Lates calcarifer]|uniref:Caspase-1-like n=2 Tax=Lates calcarifer TaxID=8187 RepID=A0AAJ7VKU8_LATCA|nr:caspase-1-like [Lates calcarifer]
MLPIIKEELKLLFWVSSNTGADGENKRENKRKGDGAERGRAGSGPSGTADVPAGTLNIPARTPDDPAKTPNVQVWTPSPSWKNVPADDVLMSIRKEFIERVSEPVLDKLLDNLLPWRVITDSEVESVKGLSRGKKAREVIDMVRIKGPRASSALLVALCKEDPCVSTELKLM